MKKFYFLTIVLATCACTLFCYSLKNVNNMNEFFTSGIESMAQTEGGTVIVCHCDSDPDSPNQCCATNNFGATCAQSEPGKNISCSEFNENCNGHDNGNNDEEDEDYNTDDDDPFGDDDPQWQYC